MQIFSFIKKILFDLYDRLHILKKQNEEIKKFNDQRRKKIYNSISLSDKQKSLIDNLYKKNYEAGIPYTWHKHYTAFTGKFDQLYFPELLFIPEFERFENQFAEYANVFADKNVTEQLAKSINIKTPKTIIHCIKGLFFDNDYNQLSLIEASKRLTNIGKVFIKPTVNSSSGRDCLICNFIGEVDSTTGKKIVEVLKTLGNDYVIQELIKCSDSIRKIYSESVNTFRIITYRWKEELHNVPIIMRIGRNGNYLDNAHAGGIFIAIDEDGKLHEKAFTEFNDQFARHPDSEIEFKDYKIDHFDKVIKSAYKMHSVMSQIGCINWDFTIDNNEEPVLIEANTLGGSIWLCQMAHGKGPFGELTPEILQWLRLMKNTPKSKRDKYAFGKMNNE